MLRDTFKTTTLNNVIESFYRDREGGARSPKTLEFYKQHIDQFLKFCPVGDKPIDNISVQDIESFLYSKNRYAFAKHAAFRTLRALFYFAEKRQLITENPVKYISTPKLPKREIPIVPEEDFKKLIKSCGPHFLGHRDRAIMYVLYDCGLRLAELLGMTFTDLDLNKCEVKVLGKGNKERTVSFDEKVKNVLLQYIQVHPMNTDYLWLTEEKRPLQQRGVQSMLLNRCKHTGVAHVHPHMFRHSAAVNMLQNGMPIDSVRRYLGQESLTVLLGYLKSLDSKDASIEHKKFSPIHNLG